MTWFKRNADSIEAVATLITALVTILVLIGVKLQIDAAQQQTLEQGARDLYREHLALSVHADLICSSFGSYILLTDPVSHMLAKMAVITCADLPDCG